MTISANYHGVVNCQASTDHIIQENPGDGKSIGGSPILDFFRVSGTAQI